jgi:rhamnulokinase
MGSCLKVMSGDYTHEPLTMYTDDQRFRGIQIAADTLTGSDEEALFKMIHSVCGGQSWLDVYNLYHLIAINERNPIPASAVILDIPSVIERYLCGFNPGIESSFLRTSLWGNLAGNALNTEMIEKLGLPVSAFQKVVPSGTLIGETTDLDFPGAQVVAAGTYDTAGAFYALNLMDPNSIFLSSGSWNLVAQPVNMSSIKPDVLDVLFDKRLGIEGATGAEVLVKNVRGTMLFDDLAKELRISNVADLFIGIEDPNVPFALIDLSSGTFHYEQNSGSVTPAINAYCKATEQKIPDTDLAMVKSITMSMVLGITEAVSQFRELSGMLNSVPRSIQAGGGLAMNNYLFDQALADATGLPVNLTLKRLAGFGNAASALIGTDQADRKQVKQSLLNASSDKVFEPVRGATGEWQLLYGQYLATTGQIV